jgi:hypothetical protein
MCANVDVVVTERSLCLTLPVAYSFSYVCVSMFANADRYPGYWFSCELLLFFLFPLLLLIAGIDDDDGSSRVVVVAIERLEKKRKTTEHAENTPTYIVASIIG